MADKLKIYACSGIEDEKPKLGELQKFWNDGSDVLRNTQAANTLLVKINLVRSELQNLPLTDEERIARYNEIDIYTVCLYCVSQYAENERQINFAGLAIGSLIVDGTFENNSLSIREREDNINNIIARVNDMVTRTKSFHRNDEFKNWWQENIISRLKVGLDEQKRKELETAMDKAVSGIGAIDESWKQDATLSDYLLNGSEYFLYLYFTPDQLASLPREFRKKAKQQQATFDECKALFVDVYGSEQDMKDVIRSGIQNYFGQTPEYTCAAIARGEIVKPVGDLVFLGLTGAAAVKALIALIGAILTFVASVVGAICSMVAEIKVAEYKRIDQEIIDSSTPAPEDYDGYNFKEMLGGGSSSSWLPLAALAVGAILLLKNSK